jgi:hypothetical protein
MATIVGSNGLSRAIDALILQSAATEAAGALLVAQAYQMRVGLRNAKAASENGQGGIYEAVTAAQELHVIVVEFERDYPGESGWEVAGQAITDAFSAEWAQTVLGWILRLENAPSCDLEPAAASLVRWGLGLPVMGGLLGALDALLRVADGEHGEAARDAVEAVNDAVIGAVLRGVRMEWLQTTLDIWARTTGGPEIVLTQATMSNQDVVATG